MLLFEMTSLKFCKYNLELSVRSNYFKSDDLTRELSTIYLVPDVGLLHPELTIQLALHNALKLRSTQTDESFSVFRKFQDAIINVIEIKNNQNHKIADLPCDLLFLITPYVLLDHPNVIFLNLNEFGFNSDRQNRTTTFLRQFSIQVFLLIPKIFNHLFDPSLFDKVAVFYQNRGFNLYDKNSKLLDFLVENNKEDSFPEENYARSISVSDLKHHITKKNKYSPKDEADSGWSTQLHNINWNKLPEGRIIL